MDNTLKLLKSIICVLAAGILAAPAWAENKVVAKLYLSEGEVFVRKAGETSWTHPSTGSPLAVGDTVRTGEDGKAAFEFVDGALVRLGRLSAMTFQDVDPSGAPIVTQHDGKAYFFISWSPQRAFDQDSTS